MYLFDCLTDVVFLCKKIKRIYSYFSSGKEKCKIYDDLMREKLEDFGFLRYLNFKIIIH